NENNIVEFFRNYGLEAKIFGRIICEKNYKVYKNNNLIIDLPIEIFTKKAPIYDRPFKKIDFNTIEENKDIYNISLNKIIEIFLNNFTKFSKNYIYEQYDHTIQNRTYLEMGDNVSAIYLDELELFIGFSLKGSSDYSDIYPKESVSNSLYKTYSDLISSGLEPIATTNNLNFGNPEISEIMWQFKETIECMSEILNKFNIPNISGNVSLNNATLGNNINPCAVIVMVGKSKNRILSRFINESNLTIGLIGKEISDLSYSIIQKYILNEYSGKLSISKFEDVFKNSKFIKYLNENNLIKNCISLGEGGIFLSLLKIISKINNFGIELKVKSNNINSFLFNELLGRYLIFFNEKNSEIIINEATKNKIEIHVIGKVSNNNNLEIKNNDVLLYSEKIENLKNIFNKKLENYFI
ncbi:AIR synthase related protein, partial [Dolichospermum sp. ST_sed3]|nr:AIR synthase related protein [Dolichospermum sp. ST_sed3]